jgi:hypothetical protein
VCEWLGNSMAVAKEHYLQMTEDHYRLAAQNPAHPGANATKLDRTHKTEKPMKDLFCSVQSDPGLSSSDVLMTLSGFEPES